MNISDEFDTNFSSSLDAVFPPLSTPRRWDRRLAKLVSDVLSPPIVAVIGLALATRLFNGPADYIWVIYYLALVIVVPLGYLTWKIRRGEITDFHMRIREQRLRPMMLTLACALAGWAGLWAGQASTILLVIAGMGVVQIGLLLLVTLHWKISGHGAAIGSLAVLALGLYGPVAAPVLLSVPLVAWARISLKRHTLAQTLAGSLVGITMMLLLLILIRA